MNGAASGTDAPPALADATGRDRLAWNVATSWLGHLVFVVVGFVMPRLIDRSLGQAGLGVWDFGWSFVSYFGLAQIGIGSSVNRFVALHRAAGAVFELRQAVSSVTAVNVLASAVVQLLAVGSFWIVPHFFGRRLGHLTGQAGVVVVLLGTSLAVQLAFDAFRGVITGCHRWDAHNALNSGSYLATVTVMVAALGMGGGLVSLGVAYLVGTIAGELARVVVAYRVCPELSIRPAYASWEGARPMLYFGVKSSLGGVSRLLLFQANSLLLASQLGPAALAVYARPGALMRHAETFLEKFSFILTPAASALQGSGREAELRHFLLRNSRYASCLALPMLCLLAVLADPIIILWMGPNYHAGATVLTILACGSVLPFINRAAWAVLAGLNLHGRVAVVSLAAACSGVVLSYLAISVWRWGLVGAALAIAVPLTYGNGLFVPVYACRRLGVSLRSYVRLVFLEPMVYVAPFAAVLVAARVVLGHRPLLAIMSGVSLGALVLGPIYWRFVLHAEMRDRVCELVSRAGATLRRRQA